MIELTSSMRKELSAQAQALNPVVIIGQAGVTDGVIGKVDESLEAHALIKVKFLEYKDQKQELTDEICQATDATLVRIIGNIAILFREPKEKKEDDK
ncbi:MAG: ribosome assembly RNA-binding protein YhbY [Treponema sp.]|nr:ribosome assembly RNA-binding protein YhbY [Treponema sp.]